MRNKIVITLDGMDCANCVINIDGVLEETKGIFSSNTSYAKQQTEVTYDPKAISSTKITNILQKAGYAAEVLTN